MSTKFQVDGVDYSLLKGKSVLIVGGGKALGLASGLSLAQAGARVTIADNIPHADVIKAFQKRSLAVQYVKCDVTSWSQQLMACKQAIQFAPNRSLDIVCSFLQVDLGQDLVGDATESDPRIDVEPPEPAMEEVDTNIRAVCHLTRLAMHFFGIPDRATALKKARSRSGSAATSITASSVRSRSNSRSGSRQRSGSRSRSTSPVRTSPPQDSGEAVVVTEEPEKKDGTALEDASQGNTEDKPLEFTKSLIIVGSMASYIDYGHSSFLAASAFALRGLFRSLRATSMKELKVRVNLVSPWAVRSPSIEPHLKELEETGLIERETHDGNLESSKLDEGNTAANPNEAPSAELEESTLNVVTNGEQKDEVKETIPNPTIAQPAEGGPVAPDDIQNGGTTDIANGTTPSDQSEHKKEVVETSDDTAKQDQTSEAGSNERVVEPAQPEKELDGKTTADKSNEPVSTTEAEQIVKYKDMHFTSFEDVVSTVNRLCADSSVNGRSIAVMPEGAFDLNDDFNGSYAGGEVVRLLNTRKEAGDVIYKLLNRVSEAKTSS